MDTNDKSGPLVRIAVGTGLVAIGGGLMSRLPQLLPGQTAIPWYQDRYLVAGAVIALVGLLVLIVPPRHWKKLWPLLRGFPVWVARSYHWKRHGPTYSIGNPSLSHEAIAGDDKYTGTFEVQVWNKDNYPLLVDLNPGWIRVEQRVGRHTRGVELRVSGEHSRPYCNIEPHGQERYQIVMTGAYSGNRAHFPNLGKRYHWKLRSIRVELEGADSRLLCSKEGWTDAEKNDSR